MVVNFDARKLDEAMETTLLLPAYGEREQWERQNSLDNVKYFYALSAGSIPGYSVESIFNNEETTK